MQFELTKEFLETLRNAIHGGSDRYVEEALADVHPADIAEIFEELKAPEINYIFKLLEKEKAAEVLIELDEGDREDLLTTLTSKEIAEHVIDNIDSDDAADVLNELSDEKKEEVISHIKDEEQLSDIYELLNYADDSAGGIMAKELIKVQKNWTIARGVREMRRQANDIDQVYSIYVTDEDDKLLGTLSLKKLMFASQSIKTLISDIFAEEPIIYVHPEEPEESCANIMEKYDLIALPVVAHDMTLLGRITIDDVVDVIKEEAERDYQLASGISESVESSDTIWMLTRARLPWLLIGLMGGVLVAQVIGIFEVQLEKVGSLMLFIPLIAAMGGNVGVQSSAIVVQGIANNSLINDAIWPRLLKELGVALLNASICGLVILAYGLAFMDSNALSYTVGISLFTVIIIAAIFGTVVPLLLNRINIDPALATGPFITTMNDIIGLSVYFIYAKFFFHI